MSQRIETKRLLFFLLLGLLASAAARAETEVRGLMDVVAQGDDELRDLNTSNTDDGNFDPLRTRLFLQGGNDDTQVHMQFLLSETSLSSFRTYGAYLMHRPIDGRELYLEAGRIPVHDGTWAARTYSDKNPLVGIPLAYYWKSTLPFRQMPTDLDQLVSQRGAGQTGVNYTDENGPRGTPHASTPILYDSYWNNGVYILGTKDQVDFAFGATVGAPASPVSGVDFNDDIALHAKIGVSPIDEIKLRVSYATGAYLHRDVEPYLPAGESVNDYLQQIWIGSLEVARGYFVLNAETIWNRFDTPLREEGLAQFSYYADLLYKFLPGWYAAVRYDALEFGEVEASGGLVSWDDDLRRVETGVGYRPTPSLILKAVLQMNDLGKGFERETMLPALQAALSF